MIDTSKRSDHEFLDAPDLCGKELSTSIADSLKCLVYKLLLTLAMPSAKIETQAFDNSLLAHVLTLWNAAGMLLVSSLVSNRTLVETEDFLVSWSLARLPISSMIP